MPRDMLRADPIPADAPRNRTTLSERLAGALAVLAVGLIAFLLLDVDFPEVAHALPARTVVAILLTLALLLVLVASIVLRRATHLWRQAQDSLTGTRLQSRIILLFCGIAVLPAIIVALFSAVFFNFGIQSWFDARVTATLEDSVSVAAAYVEEHKSAIRSDALGLAGDIQHQLPVLFSNPQGFRTLLTYRSSSHGLSEAVVFDRNRVIARTALSFSLVFERLPEEMLDRADEGNVVVFGEDQDKISALVKITSLPEMYLMVGRVVDPAVLEHMQTARSTVVEYRQLRNDISVIQRQFFTVFVLVAMLVLLLSIWAGMMLAARLVGPIRELMSATERVRAGDYAIKVPEGPADDEIANLSRTFNRMTGQLETQRRDLMDANRQLDERRRFIEAVLSGVSAGIIALNSEHEVTLHNRTALELLGQPDDASLAGRSIHELLPEAERLIQRAEKQPDRIASSDAVVAHGERRVTLHVQVTVERFGERVEGYIVTFDDISALVSAQRSAAWTDVARRIAHEIKNPLTPITLSVERLRKKFGKEITSDTEAYERYLDTIARHVRDIGRMVEEFVGFARLPSAIFREENLGALIRKIAFSEQTAHADIRYDLQLAREPVILPLDESQLGQAMTNLLKNAAEALEKKAGQKEIRIALRQDGDSITLTVEDNGPGFPEERIDQLMEPYVTTRAKGTGLGLAIVKRTVEEHKGTIALANRTEGGACVTIVFPRKP